jgi:integrase
MSSFGKPGVQSRHGNGQRHTVSEATKAEAERKVRALVQAKHRKELPTNSRRTLQWLRDEWLKTKADREAQTRHFCEHKSALYVLPKLGRLTLKQLDTREAKGTLQAWVNDLAKVRHLSPKTVKHARDILGSILRYGIESGYLTHDATHKLELPAIPTGYRFAMLDDAAYSKLQAAANGQPLQAAHVLMFQHSMRPGEVAGLCWESVNLDARTMTLRHSLEWLKDERRFNLKSVKNEVIETVDLTDAPALPRSTNCCLRRALSNATSGCPGRGW